ncbi:hypothetical protein Agub_g4353 [Astrephomene gubernaculifera]|uniref:Uncharacterized protein n=1 Tax=Astrephomene gubernaculifera TaxID=47775 RepID=A0AAD3DKK7_9CHLO|nr:hypothetical protein Agub_g4353 [Astrephomene gubernaculifera]
MSALTAQRVVTSRVLQPQLRFSCHKLPLLRRRSVCVHVSLHDAPQEAPNSAPAHVSSEEAKKRNEDSLARILNNFADAKAQGLLREAEEEDEDEVQGDEGEDWVWWRSDDQTATSPTANSSEDSAAKPSQ